jgi:hypothetical protein
MARYYIRELEPREEAPRNGQRLVRDVRALGPAHNQRRPRKSRLVGVAERKVAHAVQRRGEDGERDAPLEGLAGMGAGEVR